MVWSFTTVGTKPSSPHTPDIQQSSVVQQQHLLQGDNACPVLPNKDGLLAIKSRGAQQCLLSFGPPALCFMLPSSWPKGNSPESSGGICRSQLLSIAFAPWDVLSAGKP